MPQNVHQQGFAKRLESLKSDLVVQGARVLSLVEGAFEAVFSKDSSAAAQAGRQAVGQDDAVDIADVAFEKACVGLLTDATQAGSTASDAVLNERQLRAVLTFAKVNNELERIADAGVDVAELARDGLLGVANTACPETFRVMANSVIGILRDSNTSIAKDDAAMAKVVLQSQHAVTAFKAAILRDAERRIAQGTMSADFAFKLHEMASRCELIADHCTNIAEQVIYAQTGAIVRHLEHQWVVVPSQ